MSQVIPFYSALTVRGVGSDAVESPTQEWLDMAIRWELIDDLLEGTWRMRELGEKWLPREPLEEVRQYVIRLSRAVLFEAYSDTVSNLASKPFAREVTVTGELPDAVESLKYNIDMCGTSITDFSRAVYEDAMNHGLSHVLVDFPRTGGSQTAADEMRGTVRPYFTHVKARDLIGWRFTVDEVTGEKYLTQVRIREDYTRENGEFGTEKVERIRVLTPGEFVVYERTGDEKTFTEAERGSIMIGGAPSSRIPLKTVYFDKTGYMKAKPPLEGLAWLNLSHWQSTADHRNYLRFARIGILFASGFMPEEVEKGIKIAPTAVTASTNENAKLGYVEHAGKAFDAGVKDLKMIEDAMEALGMRPFEKGSARQTATGIAVDENNTDSQVQAWIRAMEHLLESCFGLAFEWLKIEEPNDFAVDIFNEFKIPIRASDDIDKLIELRANTQISHKTLFNELRRRGLLSDDVNHEEEFEKIQQEMMDLMGTPSEEEDDDDEPEVT